MFVLLFALAFVFAAVLFYGYSQDNRQTETPENEPFDRNGTAESAVIESYEVANQIDGIEKEYEYIKDQDERQDKVDQSVYSRGIENKDTAFCGHIIDKTIRNNCYWHIALALTDLDKCDVFDNDQDQNYVCRLNVIMKDARQNGNTANCHLLNEEDQQSCIERAVGKKSVLETCEPVHNGESRQYCQNLVYHNMALEKKDKSVCENISKGWRRTDCIAAILGIDPKSDQDGDGLTFYEELHYGTDPENPDSDGDGYTDGQEIEQAYNPSGQGELIQYPE